MACKECDPGIWICEEDNLDPKCGPSVEIQAKWDYQGRYRVPAGWWSVWCRSGSNVVISMTRPQTLPNPKPPWKEMGKICFPSRGDYDIWRRPGSGGKPGSPPCEVMIAQVANTSAAVDCPDD